VGDVLKIRFSEAKGNLEEKIKKMCDLGLKKMRKPVKAKSQGKRRKAKDIFTEEKISWSA